MNRAMRLVLLCAAIFVAQVEQVQSAVIGTGPPDTTIIYFGSPDTTSYGEVFEAPGGSLLDWSFYLVSPSGAFDFVIASWDGSKAVGPALYTASSASATTSPGAVGTTEFTWSGINLGLTAGVDYIAYVTVAGVAGPTVDTPVGGTAADTYASGEFRFLNSGGVDPLTLGDAWSTWFVPDMAFEANFGASSTVPEPASLAIFGLGACIVGIGARKRNAKAKRVGSA